MPDQPTTASRWNPPDLPGSVKIQAYVTPAERDHLYRLAQRDRRTVSNYVARLITEHLAKQAA